MCHEHYDHHSQYNAEEYGNRLVDVVIDAFNDNIVEEPNLDAKRFYNMLGVANESIYEGYREELSNQSFASRMITIKSEYNMTRN